MANRTIPQLPEQTGKTDNDLLAIVDSGETTTSKIKVSTLLSGLGGGVIETTSGDAIFNKTGTGLSNDNTYNGTTGHTTYGYGNDVANNQISFGYNNTTTKSTTDGYIVIGEGNIEYQGIAQGGMMIGRDNTGSIYSAADGITIGQNNKNDRGVILGRNNNANSSNNSVSIVAGVSNNLNTSGAHIFGVACAAAAQSTTIGLSCTSGNNGLNVGMFNTSSNGTYPTGMNSNYGASNTISAGNSQNIFGNNHTISSTGNENSIFGGKSNTISGSVTRATLVGLNGYTGAATDDSVYVPALILVNYSSYNFADDSAAATGGVPLGGLYHTSGALKVRIT
jgi:hypothetical protein